MGTENLSVSMTTGTEMETQRQRESGTDSSDTASLLSSPLPFAAEGKRRRSPKPTSTQSTCRRPCSSWIQRLLPLFVCLRRYHPLAASARLHRHRHRGAIPPDAHFSDHAVHKIYGGQLCFFFFVTASYKERSLTGITTRAATNFHNRLIS